MVIITAILTLYLLSLTLPIYILYMYIFAIDGTIVDDHVAEGVTK